MRIKHDLASLLPPSAILVILFFISGDVKSPDDSKL